MYETDTYMTYVGRVTGKLLGGTLAPERDTTTSSAAAKTKDKVPSRLQRIFARSERSERGVLRSSFA